MRRNTAIAAGLMFVACAAVAIFLLAPGRPAVPAARPPAERPQLMLLTTLPLVFPGRLALGAPASPALKALQSHYRIVPVSLADTAELDHRQLLLMAQPRAQPAETLVDLDDWVRGGGRLLLLADPALEWPSDRPIGDILRPPFAFADTGLLAHWGLRLQAPDKLGPAERVVDGLTIQSQSPGTLVATRRDCIIESEGFIARCSIGKGRATVIADADFLAPDASQDLVTNDGFLLIELSRLEQ